VLMGAVDAVWFGSEVLVEVGAVAELVVSSVAARPASRSGRASGAIQKFA